MSGTPLRDALPYRLAGSSGAWWNKGMLIRTFLCLCLFPVTPNLPCWLGLKIRSEMSLQTGGDVTRMHVTEAMEKIATS